MSSRGLVAPAVIAVCCVLALLPLMAALPGVSSEAARWLLGGLLTPVGAWVAWTIRRVGVGGSGTLALDRAGRTIVRRSGLEEIVVGAETRLPEDAVLVVDRFSFVWTVVTQHGTRTSSASKPVHRLMVTSRSRLARGGADDIDAIRRRMCAPDAPPPTSGNPTGPRVPRGWDLLAISGTIELCAELAEHLARAFDIDVVDTTAPAAVMVDHVSPVDHAIGSEREGRLTLTATGAGALSVVADRTEALSEPDDAAPDPEEIPDDFGRRRAADHEVVVLPRARSALVGVGVATLMWAPLGLLARLPGVHWSDIQGPWLWPGAVLLAAAIVVLSRHWRLRFDSESLTVARRFGPWTARPEVLRWEEVRHIEHTTRLWSARVVIRSTLRHDELDLTPRAGRWLVEELDRWLERRAFERDRVR